MYFWSTAGRLYLLSDLRNSLRQTTPLAKRKARPFIFTPSYIPLPGEAYIDKHVQTEHCWDYSSRNWHTFSTTPCEPLLNSLSQTEGYGPLFMWVGWLVIVCLFVPLWSDHPHDWTLYTSPLESEQQLSSPESTLIHIFNPFSWNKLPVLLHHSPP
jgi:hypothetical protein